MKEMPFYMSIAFKKSLGEEGRHIRGQEEREGD